MTTSRSRETNPRNPFFDQELLDAKKKVASEQAPEKLKRSLRYRDIANEHYDIQELVVLDSLKKAEALAAAQGGNSTRTRKPIKSFKFGGRRRLEVNIWQIRKSKQETPLHMASLEQFELVPGSGWFRKTGYTLRNLILLQSLLDRAIDFMMSRSIEDRQLAEQYGMDVITSVAALRMQPKFAGTNLEPRAPSKEELELEFEAEKMVSVLEEDPLYEGMEDEDDAKT